jgi:cytochrome P450
VHPSYHRRYGTLVRIGPNHVSLSNGALIPRIYGTQTPFWKSDFYSLFDVRDSSTGVVTPTVFSVRDEHYHRALKRPVASAYSTSTMRDFEPLVDECVRIFEDKMEAKEGRIVDFGEWLHWFAWDVISSITFSNRLGFMEREEDVDGIIDAIEGRLAYNSVVGQSPWLHRFLLGNPVVAAVAMRVSRRVRRLGSAVYIVRFAARQLERYSGKEGAFEERNRDMLARFKRWREGEQVMSDSELLSHASSNVYVREFWQLNVVLIRSRFAGSDTTAITLRSIFFYLLKNPRTYKKAVAEVRNLQYESDLVTYPESLQLPYVQACIKEGLRMQPAVGMLMERFVPKGGVTLDGVHLPAGTIVGINPWVAARDVSVYGPDAEEFRPERWLDTSPEQLKLMERNFLAVSVP